MSDKKYEFTGETMVTNGDAWVLGDARVLGDAQVHGTDLRKISLFLDPTRPTRGYGEARRCMGPRQMHGSTAIC